MINFQPRMPSRHNARLSVAASALTIAMFTAHSAAAQVGSEDRRIQPNSGRESQSHDDRQSPPIGASADQQDPSEIVVTGTLLRGAPPVGSSVISVGQDRIQSQGATTSNELLATVPQVSNLFNNVPSSRLSVAPNQIQVVRPNLRNLSPETASANSTLVLFDGHRVAGVGVTQSAIDPDLIPTGAIERVEVVTDGGSATYGADAVGGVINFITRKRFDGLKMDARYGFANDYFTVDGSVTAGKDWGSGSLFAAYTYQHNDAIFGRDRDFIRQVDWNSPNLTPTGRQCDPGNVVVANVSYALPALAANSFNACDGSDDSSFVPESTRHGVLAGLHQDLAEWLTVDIRAFYGERKALSFAPFRGTAVVTGGSNAANPRQAFYMPVTPGDTRNQSVSFTFAPVLGAEAATSGTDFQEWGVNAEFTAMLGGSWQVRQLFNYSRSNSEYFIFGINPTLVAAAGRATDPQQAVNFYNPAGSPNLGVIGAIANNLTNTGQAKDGLFNLRTVVDGTLFQLPGGDVRLALGYEYLQEELQQRVATNIVAGGLSTVPFAEYSRRTQSLFGEAQIPIFGDGNRIAGLYALTLAGSVRYDHFSDFGSTVNPKIGVTYKPVQWLALRGNYSTSFNAPTPVDQLGSRANNFQAFPVAVVPPGTPAPPVGTVQTLALMGSVATLQPQTATTYSFGFDMDPPFIEGLHASASYYHVKFNGILNRPPAQNPAQLFSFFSSVVTANPSAAFLQSLIPQAPNGAAVIGNLLAPGALPVVAYIDFRLNNFGTIETDGLDFAVDYRRSTSFGGIDAGISGNYQLNRKAQLTPSAPAVDLLQPGGDVSRLALQATLGADIGDFRAQATLNHNSGYGVVRAANLPQDKVDAFNTVNLFFRYRVPGESALLKNLSFTLNINNVFDADPPVLMQSSGSVGNGYTNGFTLGRLIQFGVSKSF